MKMFTNAPKCRRIELMRRQQQRYDDEGEAPIHDHDAVAQSIESIHTTKGSVRSNTHAIATARVRLGSVVSAAMRQPVRNRTTKPVKKAISPMKMGGKPR